MNIDAKPKIGHLPQLDGTLFLSDGGIETTLIFHDGIDLPHFAAFDLLKDDDGKAALTAYFERHIDVAKSLGMGFVLESPTWRASTDWGDLMGYSADEIATFNKEAIFLMRTLRNMHKSEATPMVISGCVGPRGDGYSPETLMTVAEAQAYHQHQIDALAEAGAEMITAITMTHAEEAAGVARAAVARSIPAALSFTVETDGLLPTGQPLREAIEQVDSATGSAPAYYMINCAHPDHFEHVLKSGESWLDRIRGIRANASRQSHAELDEAEELDPGNPQELGQDYARLHRLLPNLAVVGGCCGTDHRHVSSIGHACKAHS